MTETKPHQKHNKQKNKKISSQIWDFFASVKLAIIVLILIAATSIIGTIIPQNAGESFYLHNYGESTFKFFSMLNFFDMYHAWWFLLLLFLLVINLIACSIDRLNKTWKIIFPKKISFNIERFKKIKTHKTFTKKNDFEQLVPEYRNYLSKQFKTIIEKETENSTAIFGEKGRWTRLGVYIVHLSILFLLVGALVGSLLGFKGYLKLNEGQSSDSVMISKQKIEKKFGFTIKCNTFDVKFYDTGAPEEFKSNISIIENDKEIFKEDIIVNDPLRYKSINFFQSNYGVSDADSLTLEIESIKSKMVYHENIKTGQSFDLPEGGGTFTLMRYLPQFDFKGHNLGESFIGTVKKPDGKEFMVVLPTRYPTFDKMRRGDFAFVAENYTKKYYTGLQVTYDPGVIYVYTGFILMILGCFVTFFMSHQSIMVEITKGKNAELNVFISGKANRNNQSMKIKIEKLAKQLAK
ncbi:MAG: cytochrome c biogenesis protein ResB [Desulfobacteraceae bacterium]|nr:cytochrome c biogenesis protein ResB [Desulfobacteraceae bacterium]